MKYPKFKHNIQFNIIFHHCCLPSFIGVEMDVEDGMELIKRVHKEKNDEELALATLQNRTPKRVL